MESSLSKFISDLDRLFTDAAGCSGIFDEASSRSKAPFFMSSIVFSSPLGLDLIVGSFFLTSLEAVTFLESELDGVAASAEDIMMLLATPLDFDTLTFPAYELSVLEEPFK